MLYIIGIILKIIGIILAVILGILVLLVCVVLFVPVRYTAEAEFPGKVDDIQAKVRVSWLFHLISFQLSYEKKKLDWRLRAAWKVFREEKPEKQKEAEKTESTENEKIEAPKAKVPEIEAPKMETPKVETLKTEPPKVKEEAPKEEPPKAEPTKTEPEKTEPKKERFWEKLWNKIKSFFKKIEYTFNRICAKMKEAAEKKDKVLEFLEDEVHRNAFTKVKKELVWMKRFLKPKRIMLNLRFGFEDPYYTGKLLAGLSMLYSFAGEYMTIEPEFEEQILEGKTYIKGNLQFFNLVIMAGKVILDRNVRATYRDIKNFKL